ncbi:MAG: hypothetical protein A2Y24_04635 [Clostridiales bacterium GWE2_32_10]|nr:MAG: hypothetical protein A2Y24_04635 [Clostridiales bacterium GWE2_32_10]HBY21582.1 hypothetical protein [Clostridiales bacterium]
MGYILKKVIVKRYRSINNLEILFKDGEPLIICGSNNIGKTNFLRALDLFFSLDKEKFNAQRDVPFNIADGSRGDGYNTEITAEFYDEEKNCIVLIKEKYTEKDDVGRELTISGKKGKQNRKLYLMKLKSLRKK